MLGASGIFRCHACLVDSLVFCYQQLKLQDEQRAIGFMGFPFTECDSYTEQTDT